MPDDLVQITRYPNRRFYARDKSNYVSLEDIEAMVRRGQNVEIHDSQTDEDLTGIVLTRIIMERQPEKMRLFPIGMLHYILRSNEVMSDFLRDYFRQVLPYLEYLQRHGAAAINLAQKPMHWIKAWLDNFVPRNSNQAPLTPPTDEADELGKRVAQLEERIRQLEAQQENI
ncbi:MAG TPA: polyhydroxyalkanoate synthesis regulator DNA-binding domain-containing protein [Pirellulales bacterium]|nr:polyhydroxyalkanoate synthesis regulator DNA-binding domain-containing protein [Pirellulales bacterium]